MDNFRTKITLDLEVWTSHEDSAYAIGEALLQFLAKEGINISKVDVNYFDTTPEEMDEAYGLTNEERNR